jgi:hypothetical protein
MLDQLKWHNEKRKVKDLIAFEHNPRTLSETQMLQLKASLEKFDLVEVPAIDTDNKIVAGHQRVKVLTLLGRGEEEIDVRVPNRKLTDQEFAEYNLRSNKNTGSWDFDELANYFEPELLAEVGFTPEELHLADPLIVEEEEKPQMGNTFEGNNYFVVVFDNEEQWYQAQKIFNLKKADFSHEKGRKKIEVGRLIKGDELLARLRGD